MRYAILSDIHGNLEGLNTVMEHAQSNGVEQYVCGGDVVGYNANPKECMDIVRELDMPCVMGNHDEYVGEDCDLSAFNPVAAEAVEWCRKELSMEDRRWLRELRYVRLVDHFSIVHSTMDSPRYWGYVQDANDAAANFTYQTTNLCFHGHTHVPQMFIDDGVEIHHGGFIEEGDIFKPLKLEIGNRYFINVGSVGQPRDGDSRAAYCIYDSDDLTVELFRLEYDIEKTKSKIREAGLPERLAERLDHGK
jgi:diadenosine tetraphosphatase ApaH/serine/threonine PP2A family protein phosphatase